MRAEYKRDMNHNYLVLHEDLELDTSSYQIRMLAGNGIPSLLKCRFHGVDGKIVFHYEITSKQSIAVLYEQKLFGVDDLQLIFGSFVQVMEQMSEYLLNPGQILFQPEYMYMDVEKKEIFFCYLPGKEREVKEQFQSLTEYVLPKINHGDEKAVMLGYGIYRRALEDSFHLEHVKEELFCYRIDGKENTAADKCKEIPEEESADEEAEMSLEALFGCEEDTSGNNPSKSEKKQKKQPNLQQKVYIVVPIVGTVVIMAILAANMMGILPWMRVDMLLLAVVVLCMISAVICYCIGKRQKRKQKEIADRQWKAKVEKFKAEKNQGIHNDKDYADRVYADRVYKDRDYADRDYNGRNHNDRSYMSEKVLNGRNEREKGKSSAEDYGETVVLSAGMVRGPASLVSREPGELATIFLNDDLTVIGKLETAADAVIPLPTISRLHAKIRKRDEEYYLADLNSRNGTSVNGKMLKVDEEYLLQDEDEVDFAQARYIFLK